MAQLSNGQGFPLDPMTYIGRVKRGDDGRVRSMEVFYDDDMIHLEDGDEFVSFTTVVLLEEPLTLEAPE
jgi:hypothetical protein